MFSDVEIHADDRQNRRKHAKMERRLESGKINRRCKWYKRRVKLGLISA